MYIKHFAAYSQFQPYSFLKRQSKEESAGLIVYAFVGFLLRFYVFSFVALMSFVLRGEKNLPNRVCGLID